MVLQEKRGAGSVATLCFFGSLLPVVGKRRLAPIADPRTPGAKVGVPFCVAGVLEACSADFGSLGLDGASEATELHGSSLMQFEEAQTPGRQLRYRAVVRKLCDKTEMCRPFLRGKCARTDCRFAHSEAELQPRKDLKELGLCRAELRRRPCRNLACEFHRQERMERQMPRLEPGQREQLCEIQRGQLQEVLRVLGYPILESD